MARKLTPESLARQKGYLRKQGPSWYLTWRRIEKSSGKAIRQTDRICSATVGPTKAREYADRFLTGKFRSSKYADHIPSGGLVQVGSNLATIGGMVSKMARGSISEMLVCVDLMRKGFDVFRSVHPLACCDLVAIDGRGVCSRIEVKTLSHSIRGLLMKDLKRNLGKFDKLALVRPDGSIHYVNPEEIPTLCIDDTDAHLGAAFERFPISKTLKIKESK